MKRKLVIPLLLCLVLCGCSAVPANTVFSADDLEGKVIACQLGTTGYIYAGDIEGAVVQGYDKGADAVAALVKGEADAVIIDSEPAKVFVSENDKLMILSDPFAVEEYAIAYDKNDEALGEALDKALTELKADGTLEDITSHWIGDSADHRSYMANPKVERTGTLVVATNADFPPYESWEEDRIVGIDVDMMQAVCDKLGRELVIENMEFDAIIPAVSSGKADAAAAGMTITEERMEQVAFTQSYATATQVIIVRK